MGGGRRLQYQDPSCSFANFVDIGNATTNRPSFHFVQYHFRRESDGAVLSRRRSGFAQASRYVADGDLWSHPALALEKTVVLCFLAVRAK